LAITDECCARGKQRGENPRALAEKIVRIWMLAISWNRLLSPAGFINLPLLCSAVEKQTLDILRDDVSVVAETESPRRIVIDFGSPNVAKADACRSHPQHGARRRAGARR
jgi:arginyl-tRNA synthetase